MPKHKDTLTLRVSKQDRRHFETLLDEKRSGVADDLRIYEDRARKAAEGVSEAQGRLALLDALGEQDGRALSVPASELGRLRTMLRDLIGADHEHIAFVLREGADGCSDELQAPETVSRLTFLHDLAGQVGDVF